MTNPNDGKAMSPKANEAMEKVGSIINDQVHAMRSHASVYCSDRESGQMRSEAEFLAEALAVLEALAESEAGLRAENERMKRTLTYQTNELGNTKERTRKLQADNIALKAEVERLTTERNSWKINATVFERDKKKAEADLARYRRYDKLIEAVGGPGEGVIEWDGRYTTKAAGDILRAALSCREEEK